MNPESEFKFRIVRKISEIPAEEWIKVFPAVMESYYFFKTLDESNFEQFSFYYILVYDKDKLVGVITKKDIVGAIAKGKAINT